MASSRKLDRILREMDRAYAQASAAPRPIDLATDRYIIFSDLHRGARDGADDFRRTERAYNAALAYYLRLGYTLVVLGDAEELWEERPGTVLHTYDYSLRLEARFHRERRYLRFWGNHDDLWASQGAVDRYLGPIFGAGLPVHEAMTFQVFDGAEPLGRLFLAHGHQGSSTSDGWFAPISKFFVRWAWRPIQRVVNLSVNTPATSWELRKVLNDGMYHWVCRRNTEASAPDEALVLIVGHTHRPIFASASHLAALEADLEEARAALAAAPDDPERRGRVAALEAEREWVRAQETQEPDASEPELPSLPCYFNTGCCSFLDGDITGIEIAGGQIRLVRWPDDAGAPRPQTLAERSLTEVFARLHEAARTP